jgi:hypothetical protein
LIVGLASLWQFLLQGILVQSSPLNSVHSSTHQDTVGHDRTRQHTTVHSSTQ